MIAVMTRFAGKLVCSFPSLTSATLYCAQPCIDADLTEVRERIARACVPSLNRRILAALGDGGVLDMGLYGLEEGKCRCRGGWAIRLAGDAGQELLKYFTPRDTGYLVHLVSCPQLAEEDLPDFYTTKILALLDIQRLAAIEPPLEELLASV